MLESISLREFGYNFLGPILSKYVAEVYKKLNTYDQTVSVFHLAREGYALKRAFELYSDASSYNSTYLLASRTFLFRISLDIEESWPLSVGHNFTGTLAEFLRSRYAFTALEAEQILRDEDSNKLVSLPKDTNEICRVLKSNLTLISSIISESKQAYLSYLSSIGFLNKGSHPLVLDVGYSGTIQKLLTLITSSQVNGIYMITTSSKTDYINTTPYSIDHVFNTNVKLGEGYLMLDRSMFLEALLTSPNGQFVDIIKGSEAGSYSFCYGKRNYTQDNFEKLEHVLMGALACVSDAKKYGFSYSVDEIEELYKKYVTQRNLLPRASWPLFVLDDAISGHSDLHPLNFFGL